MRRRSIQQQIEDRTVGKEEIKRKLEYIRNQRQREIRKK